MADLPYLLPCWRWCWEYCCVRWPQVLYARISVKIISSKKMFISCFIALFILHTYVMLTALYNADSWLHSAVLLPHYAEKQIETLVLIQRPIQSHKLNTYSTFKQWTIKIHELYIQRANDFLKYILNSDVCFYWTVNSKI